MNTSTARQVVIGPGVMPYTRRNEHGRLVPTTWPMYERLAEPRNGGRCGPQIGEVWRHPVTGMYDVHVRGEGILLSGQRASLEAALEVYGLSATAHATSSAR